MSYPQPREGIVGIKRDDDLLSLEDSAIQHRTLIQLLAWELHSATLRYGNELGDRIRRPQTGDLVIETTRGVIAAARGTPMPEAFGYLLGRRVEWTETDEEWAQIVAEQRLSAGEKRWTDDVWYVQYGPEPEDVCRWLNCSFAAVPSSPRFGREQS